MNSTQSESGSRFLALALDALDVCVFMASEISTEALPGYEQQRQTCAVRKQAVQQIVEFALFPAVETAAQQSELQPTGAAGAGPDRAPSSRAVSWEG